MAKMRERIRRKVKKRARISNAEELDYISDDEWAFITEELWPSKTGPYVRLIVNHNHSRSYCIDVREFMGTVRLSKSTAFKDFCTDELKIGRLETLKAASSETLLDILDEYFLGYNIFGAKRMAERYRETVENFRHLAKDSIPPAPIKFFDDKDAKEICEDCKKWKDCTDTNEEKEWKPCEYNKEKTARKTPLPWAASQDLLDRWYLKTIKARRRGIAERV